MKKNLLLLVLGLLPCLVFAKSDLTKQEKAVIKALKKQYKLERVDVVRPQGESAYYELLTKDFKSMIANASGEVIIPQSKLQANAYHNMIKLVKANKAGFGSFREKGGNHQTISAYNPGNETVFMTYKPIGGGANEYEFFSPSGQLLTTFTGFLKDSPTLPVYESKDMSGNNGLMAIDGRTLLATEYIEIEPNSDGICLLWKQNNGVERMGGICLSDVTGVNVPCIFNYVEYSEAENCWKVQVHEYDPLLVFDESKQYDDSYLDEGQQLFEERKYEEARKYYTLQGDGAKWAPFYIGASLFRTVEPVFEDMNSGLEMLETSNDRKDRSIATDIRSDLSLFMAESDKAEQALQQYLKSGHTQYVSTAKEMLYELSEMKTSLSGMEDRISMTLADLDRRCDELDRVKEQDHLRQMEKEQLRLEQKQIDLERQRLREQRLAREQRERAIRMRRRAEAERKEEAKKREEINHKVQQNIHQQQQNIHQQQHNSQVQGQLQRQLQNQKQTQQPQRKALEQRNKQLKGQTGTMATPRKKEDDKSKKKE